MNAWFCQLPSFAKHHRLISIDLRGHGRSSLETDNLSYRLMAEDVVCLLEKLSISKVCVVGWSDGGNVGLMLSLKHPKIISKLVAISANFHPSGVRQERRKDLELLTPETYNPFTRLLYTLQSPRPNNWNTLWFQVTNMWKTRPQITLKELSTIQTPTLLIVGEFDDISPDHSNTMEYTIPNATLHIIKGAGHGVIHDSYGEVNEIILKFLYQ